MDSHSRSASPREASRPQHRPPSPPSPAAFDNRAYQHDDGDPNHNDSFTSNPPQNGKEPNGDTKTLEAVNLELINLTPKNGNAKKKDVEVDMNATNPYDEYFVPVNEHRKYMRGEKLYVTADKRGEKGGCKRPLCWTLLGLVVAAIVALIVLAATGVLFINSPTTLEQYNTSISSARALGGIGPTTDDDDHSSHDHDHSSHDHDHSSHDHDHSSHDHDHSSHDHGSPDQLEPKPEPTPEPSPIDTQNDEGIDHSLGSDEFADQSMYVPRTVEGELKIDNEEFKPEMQDPESMEYRQFTSTFTEALKRALFDRNTLNQGDQDITVEVVQIRKGSLVVTYRIHWTPKNNAQPNEDLLSTKSLQTTLNEYLDRNNRMISTYHIAEDRMATRPVLDLCKISKNDCQYDCEFDQTSLEFICTCPRGQMIDMTNPKKCMHIFENPDQLQINQQIDEITKQKEFRVLSVDSNPTTNKPISEEERPDSASVQITNEHEQVFDWKDTQNAVPTTTTESEPDLNQSHVFGYATEQVETASKSKQDLLPNPEPEPTAEPEPSAVPEPSAEPEPEPGNAQPEPSFELKPIAEPEPTAEPKPTAEPEPTAEPKSEPEPERPAAKIYESEPAAEPEPTAESEPTAEPQPLGEPEPKSEPTAEPAASPVEGDIRRNNETDTEGSNENRGPHHSSFEVKSKSYPNKQYYLDNSEETENASEITTVEPMISLNIETEKTTPSDWLEDLKNNNDMNKPNDRFDLSQQRSFVFNENEVTAATAAKNDDISFDNFNHINEIPNNEAATTTADNEPITTENPITNESKPMEGLMKDNSAESATTALDIIANNSHEKIQSQNDTLKVESSGEASSKGSNIYAMINDAKEVGVTQNIVTVPTTTTKSEATTIFSINKQLQVTHEDKALVEALNVEPEKKEITTEKDLKDDDDDMPITFEAINALYNRSSKSINNDNSTNDGAIKSDIPVNETFLLTTESEWLSEKVTEVPYDEAMNSMDKHETTENPVSNIDDIMGSNDDSEPDYLSNIGTTSKMSDSDVPLYGMSHDYDNEDLRVKRVDENINVTSNKSVESIEVTTAINNMEGLTDTKQINNVESTTVSEYIYKASGQVNSAENSSEMTTSENYTTQNTNPAPVWEEPEGNKDSETPQASKDVDIVTTTVTNKSNEKTISVPTKEVFSPTTPSDREDDKTTLKSLQNPGTTQFNNLKVNVYEVPSANQTFSATKSGVHSAELESEHESDTMNPFLPEAENNKVLVKKLQEGHDLEPTNLNETQNENTEEHTLNTSDTKALPGGSEPVTLVVVENEGSKTTTTQSSLLVKELEDKPVIEREKTHSASVDTTNTEINTNLEDNINIENSLPETSPVSTFLQDTEDLDKESMPGKVTETEVTAEKEPISPPTTISSGMSTERNILPDDAFLSVLPVDEKMTAKEASKSSESENSQKLNDISDSSKKSERTFQKVITEKLDSVIFNNEA